MPNHDYADQDNVNSPNHYNEFDVEVIYTIMDWIKFIDDPQVAYLIGTSLKYIPRSYLKHESPLEDFKKSANYLNRAIEVLEQKENE